NSYLIGIEHLDAGTPGNVTPAQLSASVHLAAWLWETVIEPAAPVTGAVLDHDHILQHRDLAPASRPHCASWPEDRMTAYIARVRAMLAPPVPPPPVIDWHARYTALANEVLVWQQDDAAGAEMRRDRLQEMTHG
ncbi:MAG TPA: N-acetylmuramoyl-L-alanine amidase, partial [Chloroflexota bacterium]|nr:N-acetylmuramoyl-L-alanine amidase [Chloroflexota bacterium]